MLTAALVQMKSSENKKENLEISLDFIQKAVKKKADFIFFPEFQMMYSSKNQSLKELYDEAEILASSKFLNELKKSAKRNKIGIVATMFEKEKDSKKVFDTAITINKTGKIVSVYRKLHLYDAFGFKESSKFLFGSKITKPIDLQCIKSGIVICYDIRFPEISRILSLEGIEMLVVPSGWVYGTMKEEHWITMLKARAIENGIYVIAPNQVGNIFCGRSTVIDPSGMVLTDLGDRIGYQIVEIHKNRIKEIRKSLPLLKNRRRDIYTLNLNK
ncbi:MAG: carbon-nitrogen hydrolase family protein [Nitrososphaeraceae archaeon]